MKKILTIIVLCLFLAFCGGCAKKETAPVASEPTIAETVVEKEIYEEVTEEVAEEISEEVRLEEPVKEEVVVNEVEEAMVCYLTISCFELVENKDLLDEPKRALVPDSGYILYEERVAFKEGETVFDILQKTTKDKNIHMEYVTSAVYESAYIEGINNIYELDAGPMSGWTYSVNGEYPSYGSSRVEVKNGDKIVFNYIISY